MIDRRLVILDVELSQEARCLLVLSCLGWGVEFSSVVASVPRCFSLAAPRHVG
jgi:hypothetical protein